MSDAVRGTATAQPVSPETWVLGTRPPRCGEAHACTLQKTLTFFVFNYVIIDITDINPFKIYTDINPFKTRKIVRSDP